MDVIFFGSGEFGLPTLARLAATHRLLAVVSQPDKPAGRGGRPTPTPVASWSAANLGSTALPGGGFAQDTGQKPGATGAPLLKPERIDDPRIVGQIRRLAGADTETPAVFVVIAYGQKIPPELLLGLFAINLHASLLPRWRGAAPINAAILAGDTTTGNSVITLADRMDAGLVLAQSRREITPTMTAGELHNLLAADGAPLVESVLAAHAAGTLSGVTQDESLVTKARKLSKADGRLDFSAGAEACRRTMNGLSPWPGVTVLFAGQPLKLLKAETGVPTSEQYPPGTIIDPDDGLVACGGDDRSGNLRLLLVQPAGKRAMSWPEFARGRRVSKGDRLIDSPPQPSEKHGC